MYSSQGSLLLLSHFSHVRLCVTLSLGFSRQEHWSGLPFPSPMHKSEKWKWSHSVMSDSLRPHGLQPTSLLHPWDFPGRSTGVGCHCLLNFFKCVKTIKLKWSYTTSGSLNKIVLFSCKNFSNKHSFNSNILYKYNFYYKLKIMN